MNTSLRKIYIIIFVIILLPALIFAVYEIGTLQQNEEVIEDIYNNQLDAILFSVNQYADDLVGGWANRVENDQQASDDAPGSLSQALMEMPSVAMIIQYDSAFQKLRNTEKEPSSSIADNAFTEILKSKKEDIIRLFTYLRGGYRKIENIGRAGDFQLLAFVTNFQGEYVINVLFIDPAAFINEALDPKMQQIASDRFYLSAFEQHEENIIYSSDKQYIPENIEYRKEFWILDKLFLGIEMKNKTIKQLAWERTLKDLLVIGIVEIVLLLGVWIIFRNVKKQVELAQIKSDFVSNVSHEIRTPLALISMYIESLERGMVTEPEKVKEYYSISLQETQRLTAIVNKILNFSRIESGKRKFSFQNVYLNDVIEEVMNTFRLNLEKESFEWSVKLSDDDPQIVADREAITDVIVNLVDNAMKYSGDTKKIEVRSGVEKERYFVEVSDHGLGISKSEQKHIFDKFYRVTQENLAHKAKGSGVGLAIVKHIMDAHEGEIIVKSKAGEGSTFRIYFPKIKTSIP